jgi:hypothetical protein
VRHGHDFINCDRGRHLAVAGCRPADGRHRQLAFFSICRHLAVADPLMDQRRHRQLAFFFCQTSQLQNGARSTYFTYQEVPVNLICVETLRTIVSARDCLRTTRGQDLFTPGILLPVPLIYTSHQPWWYRRTDPVSWNSYRHCHASLLPFFCLVL